MYNVPKSEPVILYREIVALFLIFIIILYLLYPADKILELVQKEESNIDLTITYLEKIQKTNPADISIWERLLELYIRKGDYNKANDLIEKMGNYPKEDISSKAVLLRFILNKNLYYATNNQKYRLILSNMAENLLKEFKDDKIRLAELYKDYLSLAMPDKALIFAKEVAQLYLREKDFKNAKKWLENVYKQALATSNFDEALKALKTLISIEPTNITYYENIANIYIAKKEYKEASNIYLQLAEKDITKRKIYIIKAIKTLQSGNMLSDAAELAKRNEKLLIHNKADFEFLMKLYIATGKLEYAKELAIMYGKSVGALK